jgi:glycosyltransferase involved in cell wall biosynthesis
MVVEAIAELKKVIPAEDFNKIVFRIYGDGPALNNILDLAEKLEVKEKVEYMGFIAPDIMRKEVLKANVLILPPLKNIYSDLFYTIKLIETIYLRLPVIATRLNTYKTYYREESLFYFDSGNLDKLVERIKEVYYDKDLVKTKVENARADYDKIGWGVMRDRYLSVISSLK